MTPAVRRSIMLDIALARIHSELEDRPWGLLFHNRGNPGHHDANSARQIDAPNAELAIAELTRFYRELGLTPRVKLTDLTVPDDFLTRLVAHGYQFEPSVLKVMVWEGAPPRRLQPSRGVTVQRAGVHDLETVARVYAEGFGSATSDWIAGFLRRELHAPEIRTYLARVDGIAASSLTVLDRQEIGLIYNVATRPEYRGRGSATLLVANAQAESKTPLLLEVMEDNAERIYARAGFEVRGALHQTSCWLADEYDAEDGGSA